MPIAVEDLLASYRKQLAMNRKILEQLVTGKLRTHGAVDGRLVDTTDDSIRLWREMVVEMEQLLTKAQLED